MKNFYINYLGGAIPFNSDNLPERNYVTGQGSKRPIGLTLQEVCELYWTVKGFKVNIAAIDLNIDPLSMFLAAGGGAGGIIGATAGLAAVGASLAGSLRGGINGRTKVFSSYQRKNRVCKDTNDDSAFVYDNYGNIIDTAECLAGLKVKKEFVAADNDTDEARLCTAGPIHSLSSANGQGYIQINFTDIVYANRLYWPIIVILMGDGEFVLTSDIMSLGVNQNAYNIGAVNFCNMGTITMSGYSSKTLQPVFYSVQGAVRIGERCCDRFYFDGVDRNSPDDDCYKQCQGNDKYVNVPKGQDTPEFVGGGGRSGGAGASGGW